MNARLLLMPLWLALGLPVVLGYFALVSALLHSRYVGFLAWHSPIRCILNRHLPLYYMHLRCCVCDGTDSWTCSHCGVLQELGNKA